MSRPCSVCRDERRPSIDVELASGTPIRHIAAQFAVPASNLHRHRPHIQAQARAAAEAHVLDVQRHIEAVAGVAVGIMSRGDDRAKIAAGGLVLRVCEFVHAIDVESQQRELTERVERLEDLLSRNNGHVDAERAYDTLRAH